MRHALKADLAPVLAELAGVQAVNFVDGRSPVPLLRGKVEVPWRRSTLVEGGFGHFFGVRGTDSVYVEYGNGARLVRGWGTHTGHAPPEHA